MLVLVGLELLELLLPDLEPGFGVARDLQEPGALNLHKVGLGLEAGDLAFGVAEVLFKIVLLQSVLQRPLFHFILKQHEFGVERGSGGGSERIYQ